MKKILPFLTLLFALLIAGSSIAADTVAKINFCDADTEQEGWTSVFGTKSTYPLDLGNGLALVKVDYSTPHLGDSPLDDIGVELDNFPPTVINSCNYFANVDNAYTLGFKITGLDPSAKYTFDVYSRAWGTTEKITKFSVGESDTITVVSTLNEEVIYFTDLQPDANGEITLDVTKLPGGYAFINGWIITKQEETTEQPVITGDTVAKINFCNREGDHDEPGWTSVYGTKSDYPIDMGSGMTLVKVDGLYPHMGDIFLNDIGIELENFPANVINSSNYLANTDEAYTLGFKVTGLDPNETYKFDVYSRGRDRDEERISKFSVTGDDTITLNSSYNEEVIYFSGLQPNSAGELTLSITKLPGGYAYISGWIITKDNGHVVNTDDAYVKINFTADGYENSDWPSIYGNSSLPATVDNNVVIDITNGTLNGGENGEPATSLPENVGSTYNYLSSGDNDDVVLTISGLDPNFMYTFDIFASRNSATSSGDKTTFFSIEDDTVSIDALGNTDVLLSIENVQVPASGVVELTIKRPDGQAGYINALIITKGMEIITADDAYVKINFTADGYENSDWPSIYGNSSLPATVDNNVVVDITNGTLNGGENGEPVTSLPENVGSTYNYLSSGDNDDVVLTISGLDPNFMYTFDIFASRNSATSSGDKTTSFTIGSSTVSIDALGNTEELLSIENVKVPASGIVELTIERPDGQAGYINALIITKGVKIITADDAYAKINFTADGYENSDWPSIYGNSSLPATVDNNVVVDITNGTLNGGENGEPVTLLPENVGSTYNYLSSSNNDDVVLTISGLDPNFMYTFDIFASRNSATSSGDKTTSFTIGSSTVSIDALGNTDALISIENVQVPASGVVELTIERPEGQAGYINALIINKVTEPQTTNGDTLAKINFTHESGDYIQEGWTSVVGTKSAYPLDLGNGLSLYKVDGIYPHLGDSYLDDIGAEIDGFPANVQNSANYLANTDDPYTIGFKITGLDPAETYKFDIYSRAWGTTEKISKFSVFEDDTITILSTLNEEVISFENLEPNTAGELTLSVTKLPGGYAFINGWIITQEGVPDNVKEINSSNIKLYPNPASDYVQIDNLGVNSTISVFNIAGKKMIEKTNRFDSKTMVNIKNLKNGIYLVRVMDSNATARTFKVIKK